MKLVDNARQWYKFWSIRLSALGAFLLSVWFQFNAEIQIWWSVHAAEYFPFLSPQVIKYIGLLLVIASVFARVVKQDKLHKGEQP